MKINPVDGREKHKIIQLRSYSQQEKPKSKSHSNNQCSRKQLLVLNCLKLLMYFQESSKFILVY